MFPVTFQKFRERQMTIRQSTLSRLIASLFQRKMSLISNHVLAVLSVNVEKIYQIKYKIILDLWHAVIFSLPVS